ncbi:MAG: transglutaminase family protein [Lachnospiraceae bacterium]|nr:transglutaminase family protein [Lachnospiraceae bacterium]
MQNLYFDYYMQVAYSEPVEKCYYTIKCIPKETDRQHIESLSVEIEPKDTQMQGEDSFGNGYYYGCVEQEHREFHFHIQGKVRTGLSQWESLQEENRIGMFRYPSGLTMPGQKLMEYFTELAMEQTASAIEKASYIMHRLHQDFVYEKNITDIHTSAEEAWELGKGVCQDYAHIMLVLCRLAGIPARYVAGMMLGEGYSHAWVEILAGDRWYAFDPTNDKEVDASYIKIGTGRDAYDCMINRGVMIGGGTQSQIISVKVWMEETRE